MKTENKNTKTNETKTVWDFLKEESERIKKENERKKKGYKVNWITAD